MQTVEEFILYAYLKITHELKSFKRCFPSPSPLKNQPELWRTICCDETGDFIRREEQLLILSADMTLSQAWRFVNELGGIFLPAHVNRKAFGLLENLGFIPQDIPLPAVEISRHLNSKEAVDKFPQLFGYTLLKGGDAHRLDELAGFNELTLAEPTFEEIKLAFNSMEGRSIKILD
jgi:PHP family Zn ribbon phosphoesterase